MVPRQIDNKKLHLQGLRAIAIGAVLLFHFYPGWFPNGYLGVDQFFFLSGYLMSMMMHRYSEFHVKIFFDFFYRRVKRIVPLYYLSTVLILISLYFAPMSALSTNLNSALSAMFFTTNVIRPTGMEGYAEQLGTAVDMFVHTWSLSLEMQFYSFFPIIFIFSHTSTKKPRNGISCIFVLISFLFHLLTDSFLSFYSVFSRIWQFVPGMMIFDLSLLKEREQDNELESLTENRNVERNRNGINFMTGMTVLLALSLLLFPHAIDQVYARISIILLTAIIVNIGDNYWILTNGVSVYVGEISYSWYLVHWPIVAHLKLNGYSSNYYMSVGLLVSFLISALLHHIYEKRYILWSVEKIIACMIVLLILNGNAWNYLSEITPKGDLAPAININAAIRNLNMTFLNSSYIFESDFIDNMTIGYEKMTNEQRAKLNDAYDAADGSQLNKHPCVQKTKTNVSAETRCLISTSKNPKNRTLLVIGNSYTRNAMGLINDGCKENFQRILMSSIPACEPLFRTITRYINCTPYADLFLNFVKETKPDVLFMVIRQVQSGEILNGTTPFNDFHFKTAANRLREMEKHVKEKIFILDAFPEPKATITKTLNNWLRKKIKFNDSDVLNYNNHFLIARQRISRLVMGCKKCKTFDYTPQFFINRSYKLYDPQFFVSFFTKGVHLTPPGLERVRPLFNHICTIA